MTNTRPHFSWAKRMIEKWLHHYDINKALAWEYIRGKRDGIQEASLACFCHQQPLKMRRVSLGVFVCDQCQLDAHIARHFEQGPNTGPIAPIRTTTELVPTVQLPLISQKTFTGMMRAINARSAFETQILELEKHGMRPMKAGRIVSQYQQKVKHQ